MHNYDYQPGVLQLEMFSKIEIGIKRNKNLKEITCGLA